MFKRQVSKSPSKVGKHDKMSPSDAPSSSQEIIDVDKEDPPAKDNSQEKYDLPSEVNNYVPLP